MATPGVSETVVAADLTWTDVQEHLEQGCRVAIVPVGSCEQHGPHLPLGSDTYYVSEVSRRGAQLAAEQQGEPVALVFPPVWYGQGEQWAPGEVWLRPSTIITVLVDIMEQLDRLGFRHIVLTNGHGGNVAPLDSAVKEARRNGVQAELFTVLPWSFMQEAIKEVQETERTGHACEIETSTGLHLFGDRVRMERLTPGPEQVNPWSAISRYEAVRRGDVRQQGVTEGRIGEHPGFVGDPTKASAAKGERLVAAWVAGFADFLQELHRSHSTAASAT